MIRTVLLPISVKPQLPDESMPGLNTLFYRQHPESLSNRLWRKLGRQNLQKALDARIEILPCDDSLNEVEAAWFAADFGLPSHLVEVMVNRMPSLRWIYWQRAGTDKLNTEFFKTKNIALSNAGSLVSRAVAEMNLACILAHAKKLPQHLLLQRRRRWQTLFCEEIGSQTVGIIGSGNIGWETARLCRALGMRVTAASRNPARFESEAHPFDHIYHLDNELAMLLRYADYVVIAIPLTEATRHLFGDTQFQAMRETAVLINSARYEIVEESALFNALTHHQIAAAYLDVLINRRIFFWDKIYRVNNLYLTHYSSAHFRHKEEKALQSFLRCIEHEAQTGDFPDRVV